MVPENRDECCFPELAVQGWQEVRLGDLGSTFTGLTGKTKEDFGEGMPYIPYLNIFQNSRIDPKRVDYVSVGHNEQQNRVQFGDIFFTTSSETPNEVGMASVLLDDIPDLFLNSFCFGFRLHDFDTLRPSFARFLLRGQDFRRLLHRLAQGATRYNLSKAHMTNLGLVLPPVDEQERIAEILSTWDRAIETTEAMLATARTQKRALMQSLLTGKRRFPEFEGQDWKEVRLEDVVRIIVSNVDKKTRESEKPVRLCNYTDVYQRDAITPNQEFMEATATVEQIKKFGLRVGDVIITKDSETANDIAMPTYVDAVADDLVCGYHLAIIRPGSRVNGRFLKFFFELPHTRHYFGKRANGAIRFGLTIDGIEGAKLNLLPVEEQRRIASVIAETEVEIAAIATNIEKLRTEKKALMQQLLTGKRRVTIDSDVDRIIEEAHCG